MGTEMGFNAKITRTYYYRPTRICTKIFKHLDPFGTFEGGGRELRIFRK